LFGGKENDPVDLRRWYGKWKFQLKDGKCAADSYA
jgi:hypothetical protein